MQVFGQSGRIVENLSPEAGALWFAQNIAGSQWG
jgi:hypothetical protein